MTGLVSRIYAFLYGRRRTRRTVALGIYGGIAAVAYALAFVVRFEFTLPTSYGTTFLASLPILVAIRIACHRLLQVSTQRWRFVGTHDVLQLALAATCGTALFFAAATLIPFQPRIPRSVILLEWVFTVYLTAGLWITYRMGFERRRHQAIRGRGPAKRVLIVGAGETGNRLVREMRSSATGYWPVGFVDDDPRMWGMRVHRLDVIGSTRDLPAIAKDTRAQEIIIAAPSAAPPRLRKIVARCEQTGLPFKVLPGIAEVLDGQASVSQLRDVQIEDLLGRPPVRLELPELAEDLRGESVLITGAAGSIGSELARQVALHHPRRLVVFDQAETELYYLELELRERHPDLELIPVVGDIVDAGAVERTFRANRPTRVYHAAAYKHVPMMEANGREAIRNNVVGTWRVARAAGRRGCGRFVLVSTDKAVRPVNVMGATKRVAEMIVTELQDAFPEMTFSAVRFGNVLGSNGSVIPIFKRQLEAGRPLTVTHPEATRYFMTIPEAVSLILQASLIPGLRGHIAMLEMGEPIKIADLAKNLIGLSGAGGTNGKGVVYTGLRPGEKLHEELVAPDEGTIPTSVPKVGLVVPPDGVIPRVCEYMEDWDRNLGSGAEDRVLRTLGGMFPGLRILADEVEEEPDGREDAKEGIEFRRAT